MSFGRKGLAPGQMAPVTPHLPTAAGASPSEHDAVATRREAFIAAERTRNAMAAQSVAATVADMAADPLAGLRNGARPATRREEPVGQQWTPLSEADRHFARDAGYGAVRKHPDKRFIFGEPHKRTLALAYLFWFIAGQGSLHRFYCGQKETALMQIGLLVGSVLIGLVFVPVAAGGIAAWFVWIFADLFLIPGMMRQFKAAYAPDYSGIFH